MDSTYNKETFENIKSYINNLYKKDFLEADSTSLEYLTEEEAIYFIYKKILNGINASLDKALISDGTSISIFKNYILNLNNLAKEYPEDFLLVITSLSIGQYKLSKETIDNLNAYGKILLKRKYVLIESCIKDGYIKNFNWIIIDLLIKGFLAEVSKEYITNPYSNSIEKINKFLFDILLIENETIYPTIG